MESTGVYWIPVLEIMESSGLEVLLVDTRPLSRVPGRKTDVEDCQWLQTLHSHGLLRGAYRPSEQISELRTIVRQKAVLVRQQADWIRRMHKCLDQMNVRVHHAVSDIKGATGMAMLRAIVGGERDPRNLAKLRDPGCQKSEAEMVEVLTGNWRTDHLFNLKQHLTMYDSAARQIAVYEEEIQRRMQEITPAGRKDVKAPPLANREKRKTMKKRDQEEKRQALYRVMGVDLTAIDGIGVETVEVIMSEYGTEISKFPTEGEFVKHLGLAPYRPVSGGKVLKNKRKKQKGTRTAEVLRNAASSLKHSLSALGAYYRRIARRKDSGVAVFATARKLGALVYRMLRYGQQYVDVGQAEYEKRYEQTRVRALASTAKQMGYNLVKQEAVSA
jgi:transposase